MPYLQISEKLIIYIQVYLPLYKVVQPEDFPTYRREQRHKWYSSIGLFTTQRENVIIRYQDYQPPADPKYYRQMLRYDLGPLPHKKDSSDQ